MAEATRADISYVLPSTPPALESAAQPNVASTSKRNPFHSEDVYFSRIWLALGLASMLGALAVVRRFGWRGLFAGGLFGMVAAAYATLIEPRRPVLERTELKFDNLPPALDGLRIGQISDSHLGVPFAAQNLRWAIEQVRREQPDLIVFTGDFLHRPKGISELPALLRGIEAPLGVYAVLGNHDYWEGIDRLERVLAEHGVVLLMNEHRQLAWRGGNLWLVGTDDVWDGTPDLDVALSGVPFDAFTLLLAHTPHDAPNASKLGVDLQLSGHTHGGHMVLPLIGPIAIPRYSGHFLSGLYQVGRMTMYVSRGIGGVPLRLRARPEAALHTLRRGS